MGNTLWVYVSDGRDRTTDERDLSITYRVSAELDGLAGRLGRRRISDYFDHTELEELSGAGLDDSIEETRLTFLDQAPAMGLDRFSWFDASEGLATVSALLDRIRKDPSLFAFEKVPSQRHWRAVLLEELEGLRGQLARAEAEGKAFHLAVVL